MVLDIQTDTHEKEMDFDYFPGCKQLSNLNPPMF